MDLDVTSLQKSIVALERALVASDAMRTASADVQETLRAGVIQSFEFVYELSIKMLRRRLELDAASPTDTDFSNFKDLIRAAAEKGLLTDVEAWFEYRMMRNKTAHTYDEEIAEDVVVGIPNFLMNARSLRDKLIERGRE